jgi:hypothetical protein
MFKPKFAPKLPVTVKKEPLDDSSESINDIGR